MRAEQVAIVMLLLLAAAALLTQCEDPSPVAPTSDASGATSSTGPAAGPGTAPRLEGAAADPEVALSEDESDPATPPDAAALPRHRLRVVVVEEDGVPVPGAEVLLLSHHVYGRGFFTPVTEEPLEPHARGTTDAGGRAEFELGKERGGGLHVFAWLRDRAACTASIWKSKDGHEVRLQLGPAAPVSGVVVDGDGRPASDARVALVVNLTYESMSSSIGAYGFWLPPVEHAGGMFVFPPVPQADHLGGGLVYARRKGLASRYAAVGRAEEPTDDLRIMVARSILVRGRCVTESGHPIPNARVRRPLVDGDDPAATGTVTRQDGEFELRCVRGQATVLSILGPWQRPVEVPVGRRRDLGTIVLPAATTISGRVVDRSGSGIAGASVGLFKKLPGASRHSSTDADGRFELADVGAGPHRVSVREGTSGHWDARATQVLGVLPGARDVEVVLAGGRMVEVYVTFAAGHEPPSDTPYLFVDILKAVDGKETEVRAIWDRGQYRFRLQVKSAGNRSVRVRMPGYVTQTQRVTVLDDRVVRADIVLRR